MTTDNVILNLKPKNLFTEFWKVLFSCIYSLILLVAMLSGVAMNNPSMTVAFGVLLLCAEIRKCSDKL